MAGPGTSCASEAQLSHAQCLVAGCFVCSDHSSSASQEHPCGWQGCARATIDVIGAPRHGAAQWLAC